MPVRGELGEEVVDRALRADVDAARGLVGDHDARFAEEHPREKHLLLVTAGERLDRAPSSSRRARRSARARCAPPSARARRRTTPSGAERVELRERRVLDRRAAEDEALVLARLGDHRHARRRGSGSGSGRAAAPVAEDGLARLDRRRAEDRPRELGAPGADEAGQPEDLARAQFEAHSLDAGPVEVAHGERDRRVGRRRDCFGGKVAVSGRPSIASISDASVSYAAGAVFTSRPSRSTVTVSASSSTSLRKCEMRMIVVPDARRARARSRAGGASRARRAPRSARP